MATRSLIFAYPAWYLALPAVILLAVGLWYFSRICAFRRVAKFFSAGLATEILRNINWNRKKYRFIMTTLVLCLFATALSRPLVGPNVDQGERKGADLVIILDVSKSMWVDDIKPNRLEAVKKSLIDWIDKQKSDRIGLILFAGEAFVQAPLTYDYNALSLVLDQAGPGSVSAKGSNLPKAIETATAMLSHNDVQSKILLIVSDGEVEGDAITAARNAHNRDGISIFTIGVGTAAGGKVPSYDFKKADRPPANTPRFVRNEFGAEVTSRLESQTLRAMAGVGGGKYYEWKEGESTFETIREKSLMPLVEKTRKIEAKDYDEWFQLPLGFAILALVLEPLVLHRRNQNGGTQSGVPVVKPANLSRRPKPRSKRPAAAAALLSLWIVLACAPAYGLEGYMEKAEQLLKDGKKQEAVDYLRALVEKNPTDAYMSYNLGLTMVRADQADQAIAIFEAVQVLSEDKKLRGMAAFQMGNIQLATAVRLKEDKQAGVTQVRALESAISYYDQQKDSGSTKATLNNLQLAGTELETILLAIGKERTRANTEKTLREALQAYERAAELNKENQPLVDKAKELLSAKLGESAAKLDQETDALEAKEVPAGKPGDKALGGMMDRRQDAVSKLQEATELDPKNKEAETALKSQKDKLSNLLTRMAKRDAEPIVGKNQNFYSNNDFQSLEGASGKLEQALELNPDNAEAKDLNNKVKDELLDGHLTNGELALKHLKKSQDDSNKLSNAQEVQKEFNAVLALDPNNQKAKDGLAEVEPILADLYAAVGNNDLEDAKNQLAGNSPAPGNAPEGGADPSAGPQDGNSPGQTPPGQTPPPGQAPSGQAPSNQTASTPGPAPSENELRNGSATLEKSLNNLTTAASMKPDDAKIGKSLKDAESLMASVRDQLAKIDAGKSEGAGKGPGQSPGEGQPGEGQGAGAPGPGAGSGGMLSMSQLQGKAGAGGAEGGDSKRYWEKYKRDW